MDVRRKNDDRLADFETTAPAYSGSAVLVTWSFTARNGMTAHLALTDVDQYGIHPFKGMTSGPGGQRLLVSVSVPMPEGGAHAGAVYVGEAVLFNWGDDSRNGVSVRLLLDGGKDGAGGRHPFEGLRHGRKTGEVLVFACWTLADNERPVDPRHVRRRRPFHECSGTMQAQILCRDRRFQQWLAGRRRSLQIDPQGLPDAAAAPVEFAGEVVRRFCRIDSRAVLGRDDAEGERARLLWRRLVESYDDEVFGRLTH